MTDDEYDPQFDLLGNWGRVVIGCNVTTKHEYFITLLQKMHDLVPPSAEYPNEFIGGKVNFAERLAKFATDHRLNFNLEEMSVPV
jgi:hypothetical protein